MTVELIPYADRYPSLRITLDHDRAEVQDSETGLHMRSEPHDSARPFTMGMIRHPDQPGPRVRNKLTNYHALWIPENQVIELSLRTMTQLRRDSGGTGPVGRDNNSEAGAHFLNNTDEGWQHLQMWSLDDLSRPQYHGLPFVSSGDAFSKPFMNAGLFEEFPKGFKHTRAVYGWDSFDYGHSDKNPLFFAAGMMDATALSTVPFYIGWLIQSTYGTTAWCAQPRALRLLSDVAKAHVLGLGRGEDSKEFIDVMCGGITPYEWLREKTAQVTDPEVWWRVHGNQATRNLGQGLADLEGFEGEGKGTIATDKAFQFGLGMFATDVAANAPGLEEFREPLLAFRKTMVDYLLKHRAVELDGTVAYNFGTEIYTKQRALELVDKGNRWRVQQRIPKDPDLQIAQVGNSSGDEYVVRERPERKSASELLVEAWARAKGLDDRYVQKWMAAVPVDQRDQRFSMTLHRMLEIGSEDVLSHPRSELVKRGVQRDDEGLDDVEVDYDIGPPKP